jgi:hypothetical protein
LGGVTATAPSRDLTDNKKKRREGSSRGESKRKLLKETQNQMIVVDSATHFQKDGVEGNGGSLKDGAAEAFSCSCAALSWFCGLVSSQYFISRGECHVGDC